MNNNYVLVYPGEYQLIRELAHCEGVELRPPERDPQTGAYRVPCDQWCVWVKEGWA